MRRRNLFGKEALTINPNTWTIRGESQSQTFTLLLNGVRVTDENVTVSSSVSWITAIWTSGTTSNIKVTVTQNDSLYSRIGEVTAVYQGLTAKLFVTQNDCGQFDVDYILCSYSSGSSGIAYFKIGETSYSGSATITSKPDWVNAVFNSGTLTVTTTSALTGYTPRSGQIDVFFSENQKHYTINVIQSQQSYNSVDGHSYVYMGNNLKWATSNVGGNKYYQWGDTQGYTSSQVGSEYGKKYFSWDDYKYATVSHSPSYSITMTKYNGSDGLTTLQFSDDAARATMGGSWRMPTKAELNALVTNSNWGKCRSQGSILYIFVSKLNGNFLTFSHNGYATRGTISYTRTVIDSSSLDTNSYEYASSHYLNIVTGKVANTSNSRQCGHNIRGVHA